ncbi:MAG TPA: hypothetical protein VE912_05190, partial [Bacteroidales bacterium]|nr:hypothetical protein [Bacteroidales bacterium]
IQFDSITQGQVILDKNPSRVGFTTVNMSTGDVYLLFGQDNISASHFSRKIPAQAMDDYIPVNNPYREEVRIYVKDSSGFCTITEYSYND